MSPDVNILVSCLASPQATLSEKAISLGHLQIQLDSLSQDEKDRAYYSFPDEVKSMIELFWRLIYSDLGYKHVPKSNGIWTGERGNSLWIPDDEFVPINKNYSNIFNKKWRQIKSDHRVDGVNYVLSRPDFSNITIDTVNFDWIRAIGSNKMEKLVGPKKEHFDLHEYAFELLAKKWNKSYSEIHQYKDENIYVWHEDPDCSTLRLIPQEVHGNVDHWGGVAMATIVYPFVRHE